MCTGYWDSCGCEDCLYVAQLYAELDYLESYASEDKAEIERIKNEIELMGYSV